MEDSTRRLRAIGLIAIVALALLVAPLAAEAQQQGKVPRIGILTPASEASTPLWEAFRQGRRDLGYVEGKNIILEYRFAAGKPERLAALAAELVRLKMDLLVTDATSAAQAAKDATRTIPIVMAVSAAPVETGLVVSLARPGGNVTGLSVMAPGLGGKRLELLKASLPNVSRVAVLWSTGNLTHPAQWRELEAAAHVLGVQLHPLEVSHPNELDSISNELDSISNELDSIFAAMPPAGAEALITLADAVLWNHRTRVVELTAQHRLPAMFPERECADAGGFMAYGPSVPESFRRAVGYVDRILKGAKPGDLPVEQPTQFDLVINLKTAQALGLTIPPSILCQANEVVQGQRSRSSSLSPWVSSWCRSPPQRSCHGPSPGSRISPSRPAPRTPSAASAARPLAQGLRELGYVEGQTIIMEYWWSAGNVDRLRENAAELVRLGVHVIVTQGAVATRAAKDMTRTIPIVMAGDTEPVGDGFVASLGRPGGNITGVTTLHRELSGKRLELLKEMVPGMARVAVLWNPVEVSAVRQLRDTEDAARVLGLQGHALEVRGLDDFAGAFAAARKGRADGVTVLAGPGLAEHPARLADLAVQSRLPTIFLQRVFVEAGGLMAYAASNRTMARRAATYVDRLLKGATPADLPIEQPMQFELVINLKTAKALGLTIPPSLLFQANEVIQ